MTPEEYEQYKQAEKEHLKKLKELKTAVRVLERQKKIQSNLEDMSRSSESALEEQKDAVDRLAMETATQEARLQVAMDSASARGNEKNRRELDDDLRSARARALVDDLKASMSDDSGPPERRPDAPSSEQTRENPTNDRKERPDKTIGRM